MRHFYFPKRLWLALLLLSVSAGGTHAQWRIVASKLVKLDTYYGAMCFRDGNLWIANYPYLFRSTDTGLTWTQQNLPTNSGEACELDFFDTANGLLITYSGAYVTNNDGASWTNISQTGQGKGDDGLGGCFMDNPNHIVFTTYNTFGGITTNRGQTWKFASPIASGLNARYKDGTAYIFGFSNDDDNNGRIFTSTDYGSTWKESAASTHADSYSFAIDSCDPDRIYVVNEDCAAVQSNISPDNHSHIFMTTDLGTTWQSIFSSPIPPWFFTGSIAEGANSLYCQTFSNGVFRSTDRGITWSSIGGPSMNYYFDRHLIAAINNNIVLSVDGEGNIWRTDNSGGDSIALPQGISSNNILYIPLQTSILNQSLCNTPVDTSISLGIAGCGNLTGTLDSLWLSGSSSFSISDSRSEPRLLAVIDSILISYNSTLGPDTSILHLRYTLGTGIKDTTIQLIGTLTSPLLGGPSRLHREAASAYVGQLDSLSLRLDISSQINLDSLWPYITDILATYTWDSSVASYASYLPPTGWLLSSISHGGNSVTFDIQNNSSSPSRPLDLGIALFRPRSTQLATSWVQLPDFVVDVSGHALSLCVTDNEDSHWSIKTLGELSGVVGASQSMQQNISIYPNPASCVAEISFINPTYAPVSYAVLDALGQTREQGEVFGNSLSLDVSRLVPGVYFIRVTSGEGMSSLIQLVILR